MVPLLCLSGYGGHRIRPETVAAKLPFPQLRTEVHLLRQDRRAHRQLSGTVGPSQGDQEAETSPGVHREAVPLGEVLRPADRRRGLPRQQVQDPPAGPRRHRGDDMQHPREQQKRFGRWPRVPQEEDRAGRRRAAFGALQSSDAHRANHDVARRDQHAGDESRPRRIEQTLDGFGGRPPESERIRITPCGLQARGHHAVQVLRLPGVLQAEAAPRGQQLRAVHVQRPPRRSESGRRERSTQRRRGDGGQREGGGTDT